MCHCRRVLLRLNEMIQHDIPLQSMKEAIHCFSEKYREIMLVHPNVLTNQLNVRVNSEVHRLKRLLPSDLTADLR